ncbi:MAG TPA: hypothetical protein VFI82_14370, partial [Terriglobales bacterium]|nr:hypothetical protein [Terriglobales bacterium]
MAPESKPAKLPSHEAAATKRAVAFRIRPDLHSPLPPSTPSANFRPSMTGTRVPGKPVGPRLLFPEYPMRLRDG